MPTERSILLTSHEAAAIPAGRQTLLFRVVDPQPDEVLRFGTDLFPYRITSGVPNIPQAVHKTPICCSFGQPGDRLWCKERWMPTFVPGPSGHESMKHESEVWTIQRAGTWRASRTTIEITDVRVLRVRGISESDAIDEGCEAIDNPDYDPDDPCDDSQFSHVAAFAELWDSNNPKHPWESNPLVWAVSFKVER